MILAVDPGLRGSGAAVLNETTKTLVKAAYVRSPDLKGDGPEEQFAMAKAIFTWFKKAAPHGWDCNPVLAVEWMQLYPHQRDLNPNKALLPLVGVVATLAGMHEWGERVAYRPHEWKGSLDGDAMTTRIIGRLSEDEKNAIEPCPASVYHNAVDAVGLGLKHLGRLERRRVIHRE